MNVVTTIKTATNVFRKKSKTSVRTEAGRQWTQKGNHRQKHDRIHSHVHRNENFSCDGERACDAPIIVKRLVGVNSNLTRSSTIDSSSSLSPERWKHSPWLVTKAELEERPDVFRPVYQHPSGKHICNFTIHHLHNQDPLGKYMCNYKIHQEPENTNVFRWVFNH